MYRYVLVPYRIIHYTFSAGNLPVINTCLPVIAFLLELLPVLVKLLARVNLMERLQLCVDGPPSLLLLASVMDARNGIATKKTKTNNI